MQADQTTETSRASRSKETSKSTDTKEKIYRPIDADGSWGRGWREKSVGVIGTTDSSGSVHWHKGIDYGVPLGTRCQAPTDGIAKYVTTDFAGGGMVQFKFTKDTGTIKAGTVIGWGHIVDVSSKLPVGKEVKVVAGQFMGHSSDPGGGPHVHFVVHGPGGQGFSEADGGTDPKPYLQTLQKGEANPTGVGDGGAGDPTQPSSDVTDPMGAALFGSLAIPSMMEMTEAVLLGGQKSYMNDKPLLPFIQQLCNASLRHFQSLPDGRFYAFYPDYFGEVNAHPPYWEIDDIEILDGSIQLSDDSLITHMYVMGDTINPIMGSPEALRALASSGVVTVYNMFSADSVLNQTESSKQNRSKTDKDKKDDTRERALKRDPLSGVDSVLDGEQVKEFLNRYGVRPVVEDMPAIRSPWYEMFLAYQKFMLGWSRQFLTPFSFTFMPELYPGGKVGFPDHALQMYIEEVEHVFDYESGFTTNAALTAPSVYRSASTPSKADDVLPDRMINAIVGPVIKSASSTGSTYKPPDVPQDGRGGKSRPT